MMSDSDHSVVDMGPEDILAAWLDLELRKLQQAPGHSVEAVQAGVEALRLEAPSAIDRLRRQLADTREAAGLTDRPHEDRLTGVANRRGVEDRLAAEWERSRRYGRPLAVVALEVGRSSSGAGDQHPHRGDTRLRSVARSLNETVRASDFLGRVVGEEFVLICPEADEEGARGVARKAIDVIRGGGERGSDGGEGLLPVSAGWATRSGSETAQEMLRQADRALSSADELLETAAAGGHDHPAGTVRPPRDERAEREAHYKWMHRL